MSAPHIPFDPTLPVHDPIAHAAEHDEIWEAGYAAAEGDRQYRLLGLVLAGISGAIVGSFLTLAVVGFLNAATPRSAQPVIPAAALTRDSVVVGHLPVRAASGNPAGPSGAPREAPPLPLSAAQEVATRASGAPPQPEAELGTAMVGGTLAYATPSFGRFYLAIPEGSGVRVRICSSVTRCLDRTSTDAGPALFRQREGRLADVSFADFAWLCRCDPPTLGLLRHATIEYLGNGPGQTPPPTDTQP